MRQKFLNDFVLSNVPQEEQVVCADRQKHVLVLVDDALCHETLVASDERATKLSLVNVEKVHDCVVGTGGHPGVSLSEIKVIDGKEVVFELARLLKGQVSTTIRVCCHRVM